MDTALDLLDSHSGRGQIIRTAQYATQMTSGVKGLSPYAQGVLRKLSSQLSMCRTIQRLFDDLPMLSYSLSYGLGSQEKSLFLRSITLVQNLFDQVYYPVEHIAWASDAEIISISSERWNNLCVYIWFVSLSISITRDLFLLGRLQAQKNEKKGDNHSGLKPIPGPAMDLMLSILGNMADLVNCVGFLPFKFLWSGKLPVFVIGLLGLISSVIPLWRTIHSMKAKRD